MEYRGLYPIGPASSAAIEHQRCTLSLTFSEVSEHRRAAYDTLRSVSSTPVVAVNRRGKYDRRLACPAPNF